MKTNLFRSFIGALATSFLFVVACSEEEAVTPDASAYFKVRNEFDDENPLEAPVDMIFVNGSKNGLSYEWSFGDGFLKNHPQKANTFIGIVPDTVHFALPGTYEVNIKVQGGGAEENKTFSQTYVVHKETPNISYTPEGILVDTAVYFDVSYFLKEGATASFEWTFPDGIPATSNTQNPVVKFQSAGLKNVTLALNDGEETLNVNAQIEIKEELAPTLYFTDMATQQIYKKRVFKTVESDEAEPVVSTGIILPDKSKPMSMIIDKTRVFVTNTDNHSWSPSATFGEIFSFNLDGSDKKTVVTGGSGSAVPFSLTVINNELYFTDRRDGIRFNNKTVEGQNLPDVPFWIKNAESEYYGDAFKFGAQNGGVAFHDGKIWWSKCSNYAGLYTIELSKPKNTGGLVTGEKLLADYYIRSFAIDGNNNKIYFFHNLNGSNPVGIYMADIDGTNVSLIESYTAGTDFDSAGGAGELLGVTGIAVLGDYVYWGYRDAGNAIATSGIKRAKLDGSGVEMYLPGYVPYGITVENVLR